VTRVDGPVANTPDKNGLVSGINPTGNVQKGREIQVSVYQDYPGPPAPSTPTAPAGPWLAGNNVTISWNDFSDSCPNGYDLDHYDFSLENATFTAGGNPVSSADTNIDITLGVAGQATVTYTAFCGTYESKKSGTLTITVN
jgi:eukaryotic-like serine/threonine-protein kinase